MEEKEFWDLLKKAWEAGRVMQESGVSLNVADPAVQKAGEYIGGHSVLPVGYEHIPARVIADMGELLFEKGVSRQAKEAVMMILAHHGCDEALRILRKYSKFADPGLEVFAELAFQECEMWNEDWKAK